MRLVVGLGNPGREYDDTRHNVGFHVVDKLADRISTSIDDKKFKARIGRGRLGDDAALLMKPQTYMNLSGESVGPALGFYKLTTEDVIVLHDDLDLPLGRLKLKRGGGHGGHNGLRSLMKHLPDDRFIRVRIGIGRPPPRWDTADYVLSKFKADEWPMVDKVLATAADAVESICTHGISKAMAQFNQDPDKGSATKKKRVRAPASSDAPGANDEAKADPTSREGARPAQREDKS
ncbi:MAG: aminoacyl-tRNA hydrolase [Myxococcota bacterium]